MNERRNEKAEGGKGKSGDRQESRCYRYSLWWDPAQWYITEASLPICVQQKNPLFQGPQVRTPAGPISLIRRFPISLFLSLSISIFLHLPASHRLFLFSFCFPHKSLAWTPSMSFPTTLIIFYLALIFRSNNVVYGDMHSSAEIICVCDDAVHHS